jgi:hypothetical protein
MDKKRVEKLDGKPVLFLGAMTVAS